MKRIFGAKRFWSLALALVLGACVFGCTPSESDLSMDEDAPRQVSTEEELKSVVDRYRSRLSISTSSGGLLDCSGLLFGCSAAKGGDNAAAPEIDMETDFAEGAQEDHSETNVQTEGVDEGDILKTDGRYLYALKKGGLGIYELEKEEGRATGQMQKLWSESFTDLEPVELYDYDRDDDGVADILVLVADVRNVSMDCGIHVGQGAKYYYWSNEMRISVYDITDKSAPVLQRTVKVEGNLNTTRVIDGRVYYFMDYAFSYNNEDTYRPTITDSANGETRPIELSDIYYYESVPAYAYFITGYIDLNDTENAEIKAYLGVSGTIYVSNNAVYAASYDRYATLERAPFSRYRYKANSVDRTRIIRFDLETLTQAAIGRVDGTVKDRYSLDEYEGHLRVATTVQIYRYDKESISESSAIAALDVSWLNTYNCVFVLDESLAVVGSAEGFAPNERIFAARFSRETGSIVTFVQTDPYFKIDLSDPTNPTVVGELKEDGVSDYLHRIGQTDYYIGVGRSGNAFGLDGGVKTALYDLSGDNPVAVITDLTFGGINTWNQSQSYTQSAYTPLQYEPRALLYNEARGLFAFPIEAWTYSHSSQYHYSYGSVRYGLAVYAFDVEAETPDLQFRGLLCDLGEAASASDYDSYYSAYQTTVRRAVQAGDYIFTLSETNLCSYSFADLERVQSLPL